MWKPFSWLWLACKTIGTIVLLIALVWLLLLFFFGAPIAIVVETLDVLRMDSKAIGVVKNVEIEHGNKGTSAARVTYQFAANGAQFESQRMYPGFLANHGTFSGGSRLSTEFPIGGQCTVFYDSSFPSRCSLKYGWFQGSVGFSAVVWGMVMSCYFQSRNSPFAILASTGLIYGFGLLLIGPFTIKIDEVHWHLLVIAGISVAVTIHFLVTRSASEPSGATECSKCGVSTLSPNPRTG